MRYVICSTPRTGSNALWDCLVQTGIAGMTAATRRIPEFIGVDVPDGLHIEPSLKKQVDVRKAEFIERYKRRRINDEHID